jgi:hypothetical protein
MVKYSEVLLRKKGYHADADRLVQEHTTFYARAVEYHYLGIVRVDLGDHPPLSVWLAEWYDDMEAKFGERFMRITRLYDLKVINYAVPVVFRPRGIPGHHWDLNDYAYHHFAPLGGVVGYWTTWTACVAATWGLGAIGFICSPIGLISESLVRKHVAPPIGVWIYKRANGIN